jgi:predicted short-subunit dehydrogenase-like oxidoreductase (DUF2520 family)
VIIGCGNVAWHIAKKLHDQKNIELFIYNHKANKNLAAFKSEFGASVHPSLKDVIDADVYFICVSDSAINSVIDKIGYMPARSNILITSGSFDLASLKSKLKNVSVFYPLQTFSKTDDIKWKDLTFIIDPLNTVIEEKAKSYAAYFTKSVLQMNYQQRLKLHLAAVLVNNFTNSLYVEADKLVKSIRKDLDYKLLLPLIKQSTKKLKHLSPKESQTGPAKRGDKTVMEKHLALLKSNKNLKELYQLLSHLIIDQQKNA